MKKVYPLSLLVVGVLMVIPIVANGQILNGAVVIKDTSCTVLGTVFTNGEFNLQTFDVYDSVKVITPSKNYNKNVSCHGDLPYDMDPPAKAIVLDFDNTNLKCCVNFDGQWFSTTQWHETITPSGNVSLTCHFKGDEQADGCGGGPQ
ncbi:MAG: hypothetical protein COS40_07620 [Deltaproteobacteria bacterium CG03_land_8_20_14_0_80_45_14]|jgi:hypothetical protein|nr:MAG: hypothetical protein COS40_07620 [Deltaproteobacteria bacterium CG03_land_8_20_14_0_80_45_14]